jgi:hypothetical protein
MRTDGKASYWGGPLSEEVEQRTQILLGKDTQLHTPGDNRDETDAREEALDILNEPENTYSNMRQIIMKYKKAHGSGSMLEYPDQQDIQRHMQGHDDNYYVGIFGDGSQTDPTNWWAALGGFGIWMPDWNNEDLVDPEKKETSMFGPAIGQTGSSSRQELTAWLAVLALPIRSMYASDSKAVVDKANKLLEFARIFDQSSSDQHRKLMRNPFGKPWGMQTDGDLWEQAWQAVLGRGVDNQRIRKVKGHATETDVIEGRATKNDKDGNHYSDQNADKGVEALYGIGLVKLASWAARRHKAYKRLMMRIQGFIAGMTLHIKELRAKQQVADKATLGYDPEKWVRADGRVRHEDKDTTEYHKLNIQPAVQGRHKHSKCQTQYEEVHAFIAGREWAHAHAESNAAGITWLELFVLFDLHGSRTTGGQHVKNQAAMNRAQRRQQDSKLRQQQAQRTSTRNRKTADATIKPNLDEELKHFKHLVRYITSHDLPEGQLRWFKSESRAHLRRLAPLGIDGHQPGIAAYCQCTDAERDDIRRAIVGQKIGNNIKHMKQLKELEELQNRGLNESETHHTMLFKKARIATGAAPRWTRNFKLTDDNLMQREVPDQQDEQRGSDATRQQPEYDSRIIKCTRCGDGQETDWMQLRSNEGFRAIHCKTCSLQQRCLRNHCQCDIVWHHCAIHRIDPPFHRSRKAPKKTPDEKKKHDEEQRAKMQRSRKRKAMLTPPIIDDKDHEIKGRKGNTNKSDKQRAYKLKTMRQKVANTKPDTVVTARIRTRIRENAKHNNDGEGSGQFKDDEEPQDHRMKAIEDTKDDDQVLQVHKADQTTSTLGQDGINASSIELWNLRRTSNSNERKLFQESLRAQIRQQACTRPKRRRIDMVPNPSNSSGDHKDEGQGEMTQLPSDEMHAPKTVRRDLHEHKAILRLISKQSG